MSILGKVWNTFRNFIGGISGIWCIIIIAALDIQIIWHSAKKKEPTCSWKYFSRYGRN